MKKNYPVTVKDRSYSQAVSIISLADTKGIISQVNHDFVATADYSRKALLKQDHNIIRRPGMPPEVSVDPCNTLKKEPPWLAITEHRCMNDDHYWLSALAGPLFEAIKVAGKQAARSRPRRKLEEMAKAPGATVKQFRWQRLAATISPINQN